MQNFLERLFKLKKNETSIRTEVMAGVSVFLTMSYIVIINPSMLALTGMDQGAVFVATCLAASLSSAIMGILANYPIALAPGLTLNAYFTYGVVLGAGHNWRIALGAVFISGVIFLLLSVLPIREYLVNSIPKSLKVAIVAGIGLFLSMVGFKNAGLIVSNPTTFIALGNLHDPTTLLAVLGFFIIIGLDALGVVSSIIISILIITALSILLGFSQFEGIFSFPPSILPTLFEMDIKGAFSLGLVTIVFAFLFVDLFNNTGTLIGVAYRAGFMNKQGKLPRIGRVLIADSLAVMIGAALGTSTITSFLESIVGVKVGGRTGLTSVVVALLFLLALFVSPLAKSIPLYATAPALVYIACLMARAFIEIDWEDVTEFAPAMVTAIAMPLTFSIADGISFGFITFTVVKLMSGRFRDLNPAVVILSIIFMLKYILIG